MSITILFGLLVFYPSPQVRESVYLCVCVCGCVRLSFRIRTEPTSTKIRFQFENTPMLMLGKHELSHPHSQWVNLLN